MELILHIDTATEHAGVCLTEGERILGLQSNSSSRDHAAFLQPAIDELLRSAGRQPGELKAVSVTGGPGSYTGLRVGLASAKGLCYVLGIPLIMIPTLEVMALAASITDGAPGTVYCQMIDARRMEVFAAIYEKSGTIIMQPAAVILQPDSFRDLLEKHRVVFSGSGSIKARETISHPNAVFSDAVHDASHLAILARKAFERKDFSSLAYSEPFYLKEFFSTARPS